MIIIVTTIPLLFVVLNLDAKLRFVCILNFKICIQFYSNLKNR